MCPLQWLQHFAAGLAHLEAAQVGNLVASVTVTKIGTTGTASHAELIERFWRDLILAGRSPLNNPYKNDILMLCVVFQTKR